MCCAQLTLAFISFIAKKRDTFLRYSCNFFNNSIFSYKPIFLMPHISLLEAIELKGHQLRILLNTYPY